MIQSNTLAARGGASAACTPDKARLAYTWLFTQKVMQETGRFDQSRYVRNLLAKNTDDVI
jgi:hypothetical protein